MSGLLPDMPVPVGHLRIRQVGFGRAKPGTWPAAQRRRRQARAGMSPPPLDLAGDRPSSPTDRDEAPTRMILVETSARLGAGCAAGGRSASEAERMRWGCL